MSGVVREGVFAEGMWKEGEGGCLGRRGECESRPCESLVGRTAVLVFEGFVEAVPP